MVKKLLEVEYSRLRRCTFGSCLGHTQFALSGERTNIDEALGVFESPKVPSKRLDVIGVNMPASERRLIRKELSTGSRPSKILTQC